MYNLDVWTCQRHNRRVLNRQSCDLCVTEKRAALHAQGICITESTKAPVLVALPPETKATYKVNWYSYRNPAYALLYPTVQRLFRKLDGSNNAMLLELRWKWQGKIENCSAYDKARLTEYCAIDLWFELSRNEEIPPSHYDLFRTTFIAFFVRLYGEGQRLVEVK